MSRYSFDPTAGTLLVSWSTNHGDLSMVVARDPLLNIEGGLAVAKKLTALSSCLWRTYTDSSTDANDNLEPNSEGWRRDGEQEAIACVLDNVAAPNLPDEHGNWVVSYIAVEEAAHAVGRALKTVDNNALVDAVRNEIQVEIDAVASAGLGAIEGRAQQAETFSAGDPSPLQVAEADRRFCQNLYANEGLLSGIEPVAAAIAAAHWLGAAADAAGFLAGIDPVGVIYDADNIESLPAETPTKVLEALACGDSPRQIVVALIREAKTVGRGEMRLDVLRERLANLEALGAFESVPGATKFRISTLDPSRPAIDLLEDLLSGISGCASLAEEYDAGETFDDEVRVRAAETSDRLS